MHLAVRCGNRQRFTGPKTFPVKPLAPQKTPANRSPVPRSEDALETVSLSFAMFPFNALAIFPIAVPMTFAALTANTITALTLFAFSDPDGIIRRSYRWRWGLQSRGWSAR